VREAHKFQGSRIKDQEPHRLSPLGILALVTCFLLLARTARLTPTFTSDSCRRLVLPGACRRWGFVMRYRSATVAELHGLLCFVELIERTSGTRPTNPPRATSGNPNRCAVLVLSLSSLPESFSWWASVSIPTLDRRCGSTFAPASAVVEALTDKMARQESSTTYQFAGSSLHSVGRQYETESMT